MKPAGEGRRSNAFAQPSRSRAQRLRRTIAAVHCRAWHASETDWREIAALYALLETFRPVPAVRVNRAFAVARARGAAAGLALLDASADGIDACTYPYAHLVRGVLLSELGRGQDARSELVRARAVARNACEQAQIDKRLAKLAVPGAEKPT